jgi:hypothetical protein
VFLVNSRLDRFTAAPSGSLRMEFTLPGRPFSRSYGANLPSSLTMVSSITSVFSTCAPVSVLVRARTSCLEDFLGGMASGTRRPSGQLASRLALNELSDLPGSSSYTLTPALPSAGIP